MDDKKNDGISTLDLILASVVITFSCVAAWVMIIQDIVKEAVK